MPRPTSSEPIMPPALTRRAALGGAALLPVAALAAPALLSPGAAHAQDTAAPPAIPPYRRMRLGEMGVTTLLAGTRPMDKPQETFGLNASAEDFAALSQAAFIPADKSLNFFTPTLVEAGGETILFDTGLSAEGIGAALASAGKAPGDVTIVVITHMHGDHIGGLAGEAGVTFANARYVTGQVEFDYWASAGNEGFEAKVRPLAEKMRFIRGGDEIVPGITAIGAYGHSPGHMAYRLDSGGRAMVLAADTVNHYVWSLRRPDWEVRFDMDKAAAAQTRKSLLGMIASERIPFVGYHMPAPGVGFLEERDGGFVYVPAGYQLDL